MLKTAYDQTFYEKIAEGAQDSAREVVPHLRALLEPQSIVDVGCGTGTWLSVFKDLGVEDVLGIDGDYVDPKALRIPRNQFQPADLCKPFALQRRFDMALSVEVAEHIPPAHTASYLATLTSLSDAIAFSAAVPNQGGTGHVNEQWPEYWKERFEARGYVLIDCLRHRIWNNRNVERWYRQNLFLYVHAERFAKSPGLQREWEMAQGRPLALVHPATYVAPSLSSVLHMVPGIFARAMRRRLGQSRC